MTLDWKIALRGRSRLAASTALLALAAGIATATSVRVLLADFQKRLHAGAREWLGADVAVHTKDEPLDTLPDSTLVTECITLARSGNAADPLTVTLKAVDPLVYPVYGAIGFAPPGNLSGALASGGALVTPRLLETLRVAVGDTLRIGSAEVRIRGVIRSEPDRYAAIPNAFERVIIAHSTFLHAKRRVSDANLTFRVLFWGSPDARKLRELFPSAEILDYRTADPAAVEALEFTSAFLEFVAIAALALALLAFHAAIRLDIEQRLDAIAILRCLGARRRRWFGIHLAESVAIALAGCALGLLLSVPLTRGLADHAGRVLSLEVDGALDVAIAFEMLAWSLAIALVSAWPVLRSAAAMPVMTVFRRQAVLRPQSPAALLIVLCFSANPKVVAGAVAGGALVALCVYLVRRGFRWASRVPGVLARCAIRNLTRPEFRTGLLLATLVAGSMLLAAIETGRGGVAAQVLDAAPGLSSHNLYVLGTGRPQTERMVQQLASLPAVRRTTTVPLAWLRLTHPASPRQMWFATCGDGPRGSVRVSRSRARLLGLKVGSPVAFASAGGEIRVRVESIGETNTVEDVAYGFVLSCADLESVPMFYFAGAQVEPESEIGVIRRLLVRAEPSAATLSARELASISERAFSDAMWMLELLSVLAMAGGAVLLVLIMAAAQAVRVRELAVFRVLGANRRRLLQVLTIEFGLMAACAVAAGACAGVLLACGALSVILRRPVLAGLDPAWLLAAVPVLTVAGLASSLRAWRARPMHVLREL